MTNEKQIKLKEKTKEQRNNILRSIKLDKQFRLPEELAAKIEEEYLRSQRKEIEEKKYRLNYEKKHEKLVITTLKEIKRIESQAKNAFVSAHLEMWRDLELFCTPINQYDKVKVSLRNYDDERKGVVTVGYSGGKIPDEKYLQDVDLKSLRTLSLGLKKVDLVQLLSDCYK